MLDAQMEAVREGPRAFAPELVVLFTPDHFNGFFYDLMQPFCIGTAASAIGDFGTVAGELPVPTALASARAARIAGDSAHEVRTFKRTFRLELSAL